MIVQKGLLLAGKKKYRVGDEVPETALPKGRAEKLIEAGILSGSVKVKKTEVEAESKKAKAESKKAETEKE